MSAASFKILTTLAKHLRSHYVVACYLAALSVGMNTIDRIEHSAAALPVASQQSPDHGERITPGEPIGPVTLLIPLVVAVAVLLIRPRASSEPSKRAPSGGPPRVAPAAPTSPPAAAQTTQHPLPASIIWRSVKELTAILHLVPVGDAIGTLFIDADSPDGDDEEFLILLLLVHGNVRYVEMCCTSHEGIVTTNASITRTPNNLLLVQFDRSGGKSYKQEFRRPRK